MADSTVWLLITGVNQGPAKAKEVNWTPLNGGADLMGTGRMLDRSSAGDDKRLLAMIPISSFRFVMKRFAAMLCVLGATLVSAHGQVDAEDVRRLNGTVEALNEGQETLRRQLQDLREAFIQLRQENAQLKQQLANQSDLVTRDQLREVVKSIQVVDDKRLADAEYVRKQLEEIAREVSRSLAAPSRESARNAPPKTPAADGDAVKLPDKQYVHKVQTGETVGAIIAAYNKEYGLKVKLSDVLAANPALKDPKRLRVGQELNIPAVK